VPVAVVDVTGAGDSMIAGALWQLSCQASPDLVAACRTGVQLASRTIGSSASVYTGGPDAIAGSYRDAP
jgi:sugar/nucleoside kinase (ribokinase family)